MQKTTVELEGVNGEWFTLAGPNAGDQGVYLGTGVTGLYDPPVKTVYEEPGNWPGARYLNHRIQRRDIVFGVEILDGRMDSWLTRESFWRKAWAFDRDCKLYVTTEESGTRYLKVRLLESPEVDWFTDPNGQSINLTKMVCVAGDPFWYEDDVVHSAVTQEDTRFDPNELQLPWPWPHKELPSETLWIEVDCHGCGGGLNPTDQPIWPKWTVPGSTEPPADPYIPGLPWLGAPKSPATIWTLPDYSWRDDEHANRRLRLPSLIGGLRTNEEQQVVVDGHPTGGTFTLKFGDEVTSALPYNCTAKQMQDALVALKGIAAGDVLVERPAATNEKQTIQLKGGATGGHFNLEIEGRRTGNIPYYATVLDIYGALSSIPEIGVTGVDVDGSSENCVQEITIEGDPTHGTFTLTLDGHTTDDIPWNATDFQVAYALTRLPIIGDLDVNVTGNPWIQNKPGGWKVEFQTMLAGISVNRMTADASGLAGGAGIEVNVKTLNPGGRLFEVTFQNQLSGINVGEMTGDPSGLTGGVSPSVEVKTVTQGARPYKVSFCDFPARLSGIDVPELVGDGSKLTGGNKPVVVCSTLREGNTLPGEDAIVDTDPRVEQVVLANGAPGWSRMNGVRFRHPIPPYTKSGRFEVSVSGCAPGQMVTLRLPRAWSRPWGLE